MNKKKVSNILSVIWLVLNFIPFPFAGNLWIVILGSISGLRRDFEVAWLYVVVSVLAVCVAILFGQEKDVNQKRVYYALPLFSTIIVALYSLYFAYSQFL